MTLISRPCLGIVGCGFVGTAVAEGMAHAFDIETYDINGKGTQATIYGLVDRAIDGTGVVFVCVPTPMEQSGRCHTGIVERVLLDLRCAVDNLRVDRRDSSLAIVACIKSTVEPGTTSRLAAIFEHPRSDPSWVPQAQLVFQPEFLTEANSVQDFRQQDRIVIGSDDRQAMSDVAMVYGAAYPDVAQVHMTSTEAELVKYATNAYLAVKVSFANELCQICERLGVSYDRMIGAAQLDKRLGTSHWKVPGVDGLRGFSKVCLPKDINGLMHLARELGIDPKVMQGAWDKNLEVRPPEDRDWQQMKGRAVV